MNIRQRDTSVASRNKCAEYAKIPARKASFDSPKVLQLIVILRQHKSKIDNGIYRSLRDLRNCTNRYRKEIKTPAMLDIIYK